MSDESLKAKAAGLPDKPGIYFFRNAAGEVVYIGKARSLRDRVRTYFLPNADFRVQAILSETADIDYILTGSEREAAFLENNFVQQHQPRFNLRLKDDKSFPYIKLDLGEPYPAIAFSRRVEKDGAKYFGPFSPASRARTSIHLVNKHFRVRGCTERVPGNRTRPCLDYDLGLCSAPCVGLISAEEYRADAENARLFLEGRTRELVAALHRKMEAAARD
ncbi:MAG: GIY-YIG nuclease family protein, partial [Candidatus Aminicenantes bacterium]|nr:GIY-YIG nuclease family protein [Candidatus Aminicenantes bacterium]